MPETTPEQGEKWVPKKPHRGQLYTRAESESFRRRCGHLFGLPPPGLTDFEGFTIFREELSKRLPPGKKLRFEI